ncbi:unnamed protein product [Dracunculus medinensis]|uniref:Uncharacterized protein n=1 Tax=Dracunculus medinensis TaxID=318479 RepID=A0A0N4UFI4_DRAME|nr:unnamed protein product [Dracunculus medinensis]
MWFVSYLFLIVIVKNTTSLKCWYCKGQLISTNSWLLHSNNCCVPDVVTCPPPSYCIIAQVRGPRSFWITGCVDDELIGCDSYYLPQAYNSSLSRCQCKTNLCAPIREITQCDMKFAENYTIHNKSSTIKYGKFFFKFIFLWNYFRKLR